MEKGFRFPLYGRYTNEQLIKDLNGVLEYFEGRLEEKDAELQILRHEIESLEQRVAALE